MLRRVLECFPSISFFLLFSKLFRELFRNPASQVLNTVILLDMLTAKLKFRRNVKLCQLTVRNV